MILNDSAALPLVLLDHATAAAAEIVQVNS